MLQVLKPRSIISTTVWEVHDSMTVFEVVFKFSCVLFAVGPAVGTVAVHLAFEPLAVVVFSVFVGVDSGTVHCAVCPFAMVSGPISPLKTASAVFLAPLPLTNILSAILGKFLSLSMYKIFIKIALYGITIFEIHSTVPLAFSFDPLSLVPISIGVNLGPLPMLHLNMPIFVLIKNRPYFACVKMVRGYFEIFYCHLRGTQSGSIMSMATLFVPLLNY